MAADYPGNTKSSLSQHNPKCESPKIPKPGNEALVSWRQAVTGHQIINQVPRDIAKEKHGSGDGLKQWQCWKC